MAGVGTSTAGWTISLVPDWAAPPTPWACHPDPEWPGNKERAACLVMAYRDTKERSAQKASETQDEAEMGAVVTWALELKGALNPYINSIIISLTLGKLLNGSWPSLSYLTHEMERRLFIPLYQ